MSKFFITTPIYYVNAKPHIGHTYTTVASDILARYHRMMGDSVFFSTGTDEHGAKIAAKASEQGMSEKEFVDDISGQFLDAWRRFAITNDGFIRTTDERHKAAVSRALEYLHAKGDIYLDKYEGLYCRGCEQFKNEKDLVDGKCPDHLTVPEKMCEETYVFKMSRYQDDIVRLIESDELSVRPISRKNEILSFIRGEGLRDVSFSRKNVKWGIPLPWDRGHTAYVWADAFLNYLTVLGWEGDPTGYPEMWPADLQMMSKDILRVHATIWPAMLLALGLPTQKKMFVHGFFVVDGQKMSKSLGNVISPEEILDRYGRDGARYLLLSATHFGDDADIGWGKFDEKYSADLSNGLGNLVSRVANLLEKNEISVGMNANPHGDWQDEYHRKMNDLEMDGALSVLWKVIRGCDEELSAKTPWKMSDKEMIAAVLLPVAQKIVDVANLLSPFMPAVSESIVKQYGEIKIKKGEPLFPRLPAR